MVDSFIAIIIFFGIRMTLFRKKRKLTLFKIRKGKIEKS